MDEWVDRRGEVRRCTEGWTGASVTFKRHEPPLPLWPPHRSPPSKGQAQRTAVQDSFNKTDTDAAKTERKRETRGERDGEQATKGSRAGDHDARPTEISSEEGRQPCEVRWGLVGTGAGRRGAACSHVTATPPTQTTWLITRSPCERAAVTKVCQGTASVPPRAHSYMTVTRAAEGWRLPQPVGNGL